MSIELAVRHRQGTFTLDAAVSTDARLVALFGRSGSGKTTLVKAVAGLIRPDEGRIAIDGEVLVDTNARVFVPPHRRRIGMVFQDARLFPHLDVRRNLTYGRMFSPRAARRTRLDEVVDLLGIGHLLGRRPEALSGGEKSRVAIGRALMSDPRILLMDEPFASLDEARRQEIMPYVERLRDEGRVPILYVSHAVGEVVRLASVVVALADGKVTAAGPTDAVLSRLGTAVATSPSDPGTVLAGTVAGHDEAESLCEIATPAGRVMVPILPLPIGAHVRLHIPARDVMLAVEPPRGISALNVLAGVISRLDPDGGAFDVAVRCGEATIMARVTRRSVVALGLEPGRPVHALVKAVALHPAGSGL